MASMQVSRIITNKKQTNQQTTTPADRGTASGNKYRLARTARVQSKIHYTTHELYSHTWKLYIACGP